MIVIELESRDRHSELLEVVSRYIPELGVSDSERDLLFGRKFSSESVGDLAEGLHSLADDFDSLAVAVYRIAAVDIAVSIAVAVVVVAVVGGNGGGRTGLDDRGRKVLLTTRARAYLTANRAVKTRARREAEKRVQESRHRY